MATEKLKFKLVLFATMWDKPPHVEICLGDKKILSQSITGTEDNPDVLEFTHETEEGKDYELIIRRHGKFRDQCVVNDNNDIIKDQLLHIKSIEIDEIDIGTLVYEGVYSPEYPEPWASQQTAAGFNLPKELKNVTEMGHNGTWTLKFSSPFYMWLLENLY